MAAANVPDLTPARDQVFEHFYFAIQAALEGLGVVMGPLALISEFLGLFENYVMLTYSEKLSDYTEDGGRPSVTGCRSDPDGAIVSSKIIRGSGGYRPIQVDWRLTAQNGSYRINDIVIDGLSMAANGRSQLEGVVERNGGRPQAILAVMRQQIADASFH
jgi:ABC-type transporter MlaC component